MASIAPKSYTDAAKECYALANEFKTVYNVLQSILIETGGMAGAYDAVNAWSKSYDGRGGAMTVVAPYFVRSLQHMGDILTASGYNWAVSEYKANRDPKKGDPPARPTLPTERAYGSFAVLGIAASKANSSGLECDIPGLYERVTANVTGGQIPDGDTDKLATAASKWKTFAASTPVTDASLRLKVTAAGLQRAYGSTAKDIPNLVEHLGSLTACAREIETAARDIAAAVDAHSVALTKMRKDIETNFAGAMVGYAIWIAVNRVKLEKKSEPFEKPEKSDGKSPNSNNADEDEFLNLATLYIAPPINIFLTVLGGIAFTAAELNTAGISKIVELPILLDDFDSDKGRDTAVVRGTIDESASSFNAAERRIAELLADEGKNVTAIPRGAERTPDALVDGVPTEFKSLEPGASNVTVKNALKSARGQADDAIIDGRGSGLTQDEAQRGLARFLGAYPDKMNNVRIVGDGWEILWP
ncbi:hypothetical protein [Nocardia sp. GTS18]|uniref:CdiA C-terminal domain-containing protein n=1 Tax=Nocardia sp. GTS18 TaxID=1778064 RepID=UPI001C6700FF|nr:hypothetical protein [Nocardia sp. GTS18]